MIYTDTLLLHTRVLEGVHVHKLKREQLPKRKATYITATQHYEHATSITILSCSCSIIIIIVHVVSLKVTSSDTLRGTSHS